MARGWTGREAADEVEITYRQLDYWARTDLIRPSLADANGSGSRRRYSTGDVQLLRLVKSLLDAGQRLERIRDVLALLRGVDDLALRDAFVCITPTRVVVVFDTLELIDAVTSTSGVVSVLPLRAMTAPTARERAL